MKQTKPEHNGASQLIPGVVRTELKGGGIVAALMIGLLLCTTAQASVCQTPARAGASDSLTMRLRLTVEVHTPDGQPASLITVRFLDTAPPVDARGQGRLLGTTDKNGILSTMVVHAWPDYYHPNRRPDSGTFDIIIGSNQVKHAAVECIPRDDNEWSLKLTAVLESDVITIGRLSQGSRGRTTKS